MRDVRAHLEMCVSDSLCESVTEKQCGHMVDLFVMEMITDGFNQRQCEY